MILVIEIFLKNFLPTSYFQTTHSIPNSAPKQQVRMTWVSIHPVSIQLMLRIRFLLSLFFLLYVFQRFFLSKHVFRLKTTFGMIVRHLVAVALNLTLRFKIIWCKYQTFDIYIRFLRLRFTSSCVSSFMYY